MKKQVQLDAMKMDKMLDDPMAHLAAKEFDEKIKERNAALVR